MSRSSTSRAWQEHGPLAGVSNQKAQESLGLWQYPTRAGRRPQFVGGATQGCSPLRVGLGHGSHSLP